MSGVYTKKYIVAIQANDANLFNCIAQYHAIPLPKILKERKAAQSYTVNHGSLRSELGSILSFSLFGSM